MSRCPICNTKLKVEDYSDYPYYEEVYRGCTKCEYGEYTWCGNYSVGLDMEENSPYSLHWSYCTRLTDTQKRRHRKHMWSYRKMLLRNRKIKGKGNMKLL